MDVILTSILIVVVVAAFVVAAKTIDQQRDRIRELEYQSRNYNANYDHHKDAEAAYRNTLQIIRQLVCKHIGLPGESFEIELPDGDTVECVVVERTHGEVE